jgi:hypothetical protein
MDETDQIGENEPENTDPYELEDDAIQLIRRN